ncbi:MAG: hypothetical protein R2856_37445 [Caldilineaceae bacterium]
MSDNQQADTSDTSATSATTATSSEKTDLLAHLNQLSLDDALSFLDNRQLDTAETVSLLVAAALDEAESASRAADHKLKLATQINQRLGRQPALAAHILYAQARLHLHLGDLQEAESALHTAQSHWRSLEDTAAPARATWG